MPVCIAGMHRSGTSMIAKLLDSCGLYLGPQNDLIPAATDNPDGFWENAHFVAINDSVLKAVGGSWDMPSASHPAKWDEHSEIAALKQRANELIASFNNKEPWGWKDPRSCITLPFWQSLIPNLKVVICLRHPLEVAKSLEQRNHTSEWLGLNLWASYSLRVLSSTAPENRIITHYDAYFQDPVGEIRRVLEFLGIAASDQTISAACAGAAASLRHHRATIQDLLTADVPVDVLKLYSTMIAESGPIFQSVLSGEPAAELMLAGSLEEIEAGSHPKKRLMSLESCLWTRERSIEELNEQIAHKQRTIEWLSLENERKGQAISQLKTQISAVQAETERLDRDMHVILTSKTWTWSSGLRRAGGWFLPHRKAIPAATSLETDLSAEQALQAPADNGAAPWVDRNTPVPLLPTKNPSQLIRQAVTTLQEQGPAGLWAAFQRRKAYMRFSADPGATIADISPPPLVSIVIPVFNNLHYTKQCLESIARAPARASLEVIVVDNNSTDGTSQWLAKIAAENANVRFITHHANLGFAAGVNSGAVMARGKYIVVSNNDVLMTPGWLDTLIATFETDPSIGIVSPVTNYVGEGPQLLRQFADIGPESADTVAAELASLGGKPFPVIDRLVFFCVMIRRNLWELVGGLSSAYGMGNFEDDDFCLRARLAGFKLVVNPAAFIFHHGSRTFKEQKISHTELMEKNRRIFFERMAEFSCSPLPSRPRKHKTPLISVVVRTVNRPGMLRMALNSLVNQTFDEFEVVLVNDGGPELSSLVKEFEDKLAIHYVHHDKPAGRTPALNAGVRAAGGKFITYLDDDDIVYPLHLELLADAFNRHPGTLVVYGDANHALCHVDESGEVVVSRLPSRSFDFNARDLLVENRIPILSFMHDKTCFEKVGGFNESIDLLEDWDFLIRLSQIATFRHVPRITSEYRFRANKNVDNSIAGRRSEARESLLRTYERYPTNDKELLERRRCTIESMSVQIKDLQKIQQLPYSEVEKSYLTLFRVTGFSAGDLVHQGYRA